jgi:hypothetical protein
MESNVYYIVTTARFLLLAGHVKCSVHFLAYFRSTGIFFFHITQFITRLVFISDFKQEFSMHFCILNTCELSRSFLPPWSERPKNIYWEIISRSSSFRNFIAVFSFFVYLCYKHTPQLSFVLNSLPTPYP